MEAQFVNMINFGKCVKISREAIESLKRIDEASTDLLDQVTAVQTINDLEVAKQVIILLLGRTESRK